MFKRSCITLSILLMTSFFTLALDDQGNPNDPNENNRANACYEDGSMADKCTTEWEWECGWHLIQFEYDLTSRDEFPIWCMSIIPPEELPEELSEELTVAIVGCANLSGFWVIFPATKYLPEPIFPGYPVHTDSTCTVPSGQVLFGLSRVLADNKADADALCIANGHPSANSKDNDTYTCDN